MRTRVVVAAIVLAIVGQLATGGLGFGAEKKADRKARPNLAFAPVQDDPALPRVLLIGDSISIGYTPAVRAALAGKANVHRPATNCGPTTLGLAELDKWLGSGKWDVIHFNWGLHDLRIDNGVSHQVPLEQYEKNLTELVRRLQEIGAKLIWCTTTPVPDGTKNRRRGDEVKYNAVAKKIMDAHGIAINDLYSFALPQLAKIQLPANVHFTDEGSKILGQRVADAIQQALRCDQADKNKAGKQSRTSKSGDQSRK